LLVARRTKGDEAERAGHADTADAAEAAGDAGVALPDAATATASDARTSDGGKGRLPRRWRCLQVCIVPSASRRLTGARLRLYIHPKG
jgi:hypothetical protein